MTGSVKQLVMRRRSGLTLPELLVAIVLFGTMGALLLPRLVPAAAPRPLGEARQIWSGADSSEGSGPTLVEPELSDRGFIGAQLDPQLTPGGHVRVRGLLAGRPAHRAGLRPFDVIVRVNRASTRNRGVDAVAHLITNGRPGTRVRLTVRRPGDAGLVELRVVRRSFLSVYLPGIVGY